MSAAGEGRTSGAPAPPAPGTVAWRSWWVAELARRRPGRLACALSLLLAGSAAAAALLPPLAGALVLVALLLSLDHVLLPVEYRADREGVVARTALRRRRHAWSEFSSVARSPEGVLLARPVRGSLHLLAGAAADAVEALARGGVSAAAAAAGQTGGAPPTIVGP